MNLINTFILWIWVLGISLLIPTSLPAGGLQKSIIEKRENSFTSPLIAFKEFKLLSGVTKSSSVLTTVQPGAAVEVLKSWESPHSGRWLLVNVLSQDFYQLFYKKGWVNISNFS